MRGQWRPTGGLQAPDGKWGYTCIETRMVSLEAPPAWWDGWFEGMPPDMRGNLEEPKP